MTGRSRVLEYLMNHNGITSLEAFNALGETRLSDKIFVLKKKGYPIRDEWIEVRNRYGSLCRVKRYYLPDEEKELSR